MIVRINIDSCWHDEDEANEIAAKWHKDYEITATFNDGSDYYSTWSIEGYFENVKKFLTDEYVPAFGGEKFLDPEGDEDIIRIINMK
jgi:hypothetical protein